MSETTKRWQHAKGGIYREVGRAKLQASTGMIGEDNIVVVYQSEADGSLWARERHEFEDGRFVALPVEGSIDDDGWEWAVVEVFGHRKHAGRTREEERFGAKLLRIDVPNKGDPAAHGWTTHYYGGSSLFSFTPATREACLKANKPYEPPARYALTHDDDEDVS